MSNQKKKGKKKTPSTSSKSLKGPIEDDDFPDAILFDDDGTISGRDCLDISKLLLSTGKQLSKTGTTFLEVFQNRCALSIGTALITLYELFEGANEECQKVLQFRIVLMYLVYKSRDLEPALRRKQDKSDPKSKDIIAGHPFLDFFLIAYEEKISKSETLIAAKILDRKATDLGSMTPSDVIKTAEAADLESACADDVEKQMMANRMRWPIGYEEYLSSAVTSNTVVKKPNIDVSSLTLEDLTRISITLLVKKTGTLPSRNLGTYELMNFVQPTQHEYDHNPRESADIRDFTVFNTDYEDDIPDDELEQDREKAEQTVIEKASQTFLVQEAANLNLTELDEDLTDRKTATAEETKITPVDKILKGESLSPNEIRAMLKIMNECDLDDPILDRLKGLNGKNLRKFIEENVKVASEAAFKIVSQNPVLIHIYMNVLLEMDVSVQGLELVRRLYENIPNLSFDPLREFVFSIMDHCQNGTISSSQLVRTVRMVCMFVTSLVKHGLLKNKNVLLGIQDFVLKHREIKEATILYQVIVNVMKTPVES
ncbi:unnamed protein product [Auanema sp. JU1783]|nr:unnamed protein product [Auanema sp. JU1783]